LKPGLSRFFYIKRNYSALNIKEIKYIFFDLDRTLWDFEKNMMETMIYLFQTHVKNLVNISFNDFLDRFNIVHEALWYKYRIGQINKDKLRNSRFYLTLKYFGIIDRNLSSLVNKQYLEICPNKNNLFQGTIEILDYLYSKYSLNILTNGFYETQIRKLSNCNLDKYFQNIFSSEKIGYNKPDRRIFAHAINSLNAKKNQCIMIGDDPIVDILGAANYGIQQVFFNPYKKEIQTRATFEISSLIQIKEFL